MKFTSALINLAWDKRRQAATRYNCSLGEIPWKDCLLWAKEINKKESISPSEAIKEVIGEAYSLIEKNEEIRDDFKDSATVKDWKLKRVYINSKGISIYVDLSNKKVMASKGKNYINTDDFLEIGEAILDSLMNKKIKVAFY